MSQESDFPEISDASSPSLLSNLRQFRFQKTIKRMPSVMSTEENDSDVTQDSSQIVNTRKRIVKCIEESDTEEDTSSMNNAEIDEDIRITKGTKSTEGDKEFSTQETNDARDNAEIDTEGTSSNNIDEIDEAAEVAAKEECLQKLTRLFPTIDGMVLQDALLRNSWDLDRTIAHLNNSKSTGQMKRSRESPPRDRARKKVKRKDIDDIEEDKVDEGDEDAEKYDKKVFNSDESDDDDDSSDEMVGDRRKVLDFLSNASALELRSVPNCSQKKADVIIEMRPFNGWKDMVQKFQNGKYLGTDLLNSTQDFLHMRQDVRALMKKCMRLASQMEHAVSAGAKSIKMQPPLLTDSLTLTGYQMVGLNWLWAMHDQKLNGILADEMGLGKTIQVIALLAHIKEHDPKPHLPHLIVVPSSTLDNWKNEFDRWCPCLTVVIYHGSPDERKLMRVKWARNGLNDTDVILTTYSMVSSSPEEKKMFRVLEMHYVVLDEAHMLKNMTTQRYETLMRINARHRILLTGTPLQNSLLELMSLLIFVMPKMFARKKDHLKSLFSKTPKQILDANEDEKLPKFEQEQVAQARRIMKPFVLRRLKVDVLKDVPPKTNETLMCPLTESQREKYDELIKTFSRDAGKVNPESSMSMMMQLRKMSNHPLLLRYYYQEEHLKELAKILVRDPTFKKDNEQYIFEDLTIMSDFEIHSLTQNKGLSDFYLPTSLIFESGKFQKLDSLLPELQDGNHRVIIFSQFVIMLDVMEDYLKLRKYNFLRLDGSTPVQTRQELIDRYNEDSSIFVFMLSTRAGGMGINLTAADTVIIHDIDFNPYNDKQAEDRCHRVGQSREVRVLRLLSEGTIEEGIYRIAEEKLTLEKEIHNPKDAENAETKCVVSLLKQTLGLDGSRSLSNEEGKP